MKNNLAKIPLKSFLLYLCIALFLTTGVTFSKYITSSNGGDSARVAKFGELSLYETVDGTKVTTQNLIYTPGVNITKNPAVDFESNELAAYVFVKIDAENWTFNNTDNSFSITNESEEPKDRLKWTVNTTAWKKLTVDNETVYYIYVPAGTELKDVPIIKDNQITVSSDITNSELNKIQNKISNVKFTSYAVQANGFEDALTAWDSVSK